MQSQMDSDGSIDGQEALATPVCNVVEILCDQTIGRQKKDGTSSVKVRTDVGITPGIKSDTSPKGDQNAGDTRVMKKGAIERWENEGGEIPLATQTSKASQ